MGWCISGEGSDCKQEQLGVLRRACLSAIACLLQAVSSDDRDALQHVLIPKAATGFRIKTGAN